MINLIIFVIIVFSYILFPFSAVYDPAVSELAKRVGMVVVSVGYVSFSP